MQMLRVTSTPVFVAAPLYNLAVLEAGLADSKGVSYVESDIVPFDHDPASAGYHLRTQYVDGYAASTKISHYEASRTEADARHALAAAIEGSRLLELMTRPPSIGAPRAGYTRIFVDRRSRYVEFPTHAPPLPAQAVLDALAAYRRIVARSRAAAT
ncbi:MAG: hypothetical protein JWN41_336 [Thermoleophilia bacterium]|nr:hypothetical protein [Thermoleophilia bacterium]